MSGMFADWLPSRLQSLAEVESLREQSQSLLRRRLGHLYRIGKWGWPRSTRQSGARGPASTGVDQDAVDGIGGSIKRSANSGQVSEGVASFLVNEVQLENHAPLGSDPLPVLRAIRERSLHEETSMRPSPHDGVIAGVEDLDGEPVPHATTVGPRPCAG